VAARAEDALALADPRRGFVIYPYLSDSRGFPLLAGAPVGAWVAITNHLPWEAWLLGAAVAFWVAGFDLFYALFDADVDREQGLHSIVTRFGVRGAFIGARLAHAATVACLVGVGLGLDVGALYWIGVGVVAALLAYEHSLVRPGDLRRLDAAFFTMNGVISVAFAAFVIADAVS
jgi:4-hydroxybenzoate polyprenyltransferase